MALVGVGAKGDTKKLLLGLSIMVGVVTIIVHLKNINRMDTVEASNGERLSVLEEKVSQLEKN